MYIIINGTVYSRTIVNPRRSFQKFPLPPLFVCVCVGGGGVVVVAHPFLGRQNCTISIIILQLFNSFSTGSHIPSLMADLYENCFFLLIVTNFNSLKPPTHLGSLTCVYVIFLHAYTHGGLQF